MTNRNKMMRVIFVLSLAIALCGNSLSCFAEEKKQSINNMAHIPAGTFWDYQSPPKEKYIQVYLDDFYIDIFEVSVADYAACVDSGSCSDKPFKRFMQESKATGYPESYKEALEKARTDQYPMTYVTFEESVSYCASIGKRLPTEAEWKKAARGSDDKRGYPWGDEKPDCSKVNTKKCFDGPIEAHDTRFPPSPYGVYNIIGNVSERVLDTFHTSFLSNKPLRNPLCTVAVFNSFPPRIKGMFIDQRTAKGGHFKDSSYIDGGSMMFDETADQTTGFRCVKSELSKPEDFNK